MNYTVGNWSVADLVTDSASTKTKSIAVPNLTWADYARLMDEPSEAQMTNVTSAQISSPETVRYARKEVSDVYSKSGIPTSAQMPVRTGVQVMAGINTSLKVVNTISGDEFVAPCRAWTVYQFPLHPAITKDAVQYLMLRNIAVQLDDNGSVDASRILEVARGVILPTEL